MNAVVSFYRPGRQGTVQAHQIAAPLSAENFKLQAYIPYLIEFQTTFDLGFMLETIKWSSVHHS